MNTQPTLLPTCPKVFILVPCILLVVLAGSSCTDTGSTGHTGLRLHYTYGSSAGPNIYSAWIENNTGSFIRPLAICERLLGLGGVSLTGSDVLPWWHINKYPHMAANEVDAVTAATLSYQDIDFDFNLGASDPRQFWICFETDFSFDSNDWFGDQPALLYRVWVDLDSAASSWTLEFAGWTPHSTILTEARNATGSTSLQAGDLVSEKRYITNHKANGGGFGGADQASATQVVAGLELVKLP